MSNKRIKPSGILQVDQDEDGIFGRRVIKERNFEVWLKPLSPITIKDVDHWQYAVVYFNRNTLGTATYVGIGRLNGLNSLNRSNEIE